VAGFCHPATVLSSTKDEVFRDLVRARVRRKNGGTANAQTENRATRRTM